METPFSEKVRARTQDDERYKDVQDVTIELTVLQLSVGSCKEQQEDSSSASPVAGRRISRRAEPLPGRVHALSSGELCRL
jgi:hypothetical protein